MNKKTLSNYILAFDEINALTAVSYNTASETTEDQTVQVNQIADDILSLLINAYRKGVQAASEMLAYDLTVDVRSMDEVIYLVIDGKTFEDRVADHVLSGDLQGLQTLAESEFHGDHAAYPGGFTKAENNVNCRCTVELHIDAEEE